MDELKNNNLENDHIFSKRIRAGKRTYFIDVKSTRENDYYLTITESKRKHGDEGYLRHKIFLYKEDFNKFVTGLCEAVDHIKTELLPDFDYDKFDDNEEDATNSQDIAQSSATESKPSSPAS